MSTNKTTNYNLHAWVPGDDFLRTEFNENFAAIDGLLGEMPRNRKLRIVAGSYIGEAVNPQKIELGFRPKAVYVAAKGGGDLYDLILDGVEDKYGSVTDTGFAVSGTLCIQLSSTYPHNGESVNPYRYIAFGWED